MVDLEGRPVAAWVRPTTSGSPGTGACRPGSTGPGDRHRGPLAGLDQLPASIIATTGLDGRVRLAGIGRDRLAEVFVSGPTIATDQLYIANRDGRRSVPSIHWPR